MKCQFLVSAYSLFNDKKGKSRYEGEVGKRRITNFSVISDALFKEKIRFQKKSLV